MERRWLAAAGGEAAPVAGLPGSFDRQAFKHARVPATAKACQGRGRGWMDVPSVSALPERKQLPALPKYSPVIAWDRGGMVGGEIPGIFALSRSSAVFLSKLILGMGGRGVGCLFVGFFVWLVF